MLKKEDLKEGEIYFYHNCHIALYPIGLSIDIDQNLYKNEKWKWTLGIQEVTPEQRKWWNVCNKQNKFIPKEELSKYDDNGNELSEKLKEGCYYKVADNNFWMIIKIINPDNGLSDYGNLRANADYISSNGNFGRNRSCVYAYNDCRTCIQLDENSEDVQWLKECIKKGQYVNKSDVNKNPIVLLPKEILIENQKLTFKQQFLLSDFDKEEFNCSDIVRSCHNISCSVCPFTGTKNTEKRMKWLQEYIEKNTSTSTPQPINQYLTEKDSVNNNFKVGDWIVGKDSTDKTLYQIDKIVSEKEWSIKHKGGTHTYRFPFDTIVRHATESEIKLMTSNKPTPIVEVICNKTNSTDTSSIQFIASNDIEIPKTKEIKTNIELLTIKNN